MKFTKENRLWTHIGGELLRRATGLRERLLLRVSDLRDLLFERWPERLRERPILRFERRYGDNDFLRDRVRSRSLDRSPFRETDLFRE